MRDYPNSDYVEKAKDQLNIIGAAIPPPDPIKKDLPPCEKPTFMQNMMQQISGNADVTTSKDGILITKHGEGTDLIDKAIANNGTLPESIQPVIQRTPPAKSVAPASQNTEPADTTGEKKKIGISVQSSPNGPQPDRINPSLPASTRPRSTQPANPKPEAVPTPSPKP